VTNAKALAVTLGELKRLGRLEKIDTALVEAVRSMAAALDQNPSNAGLWRQYREAVEGLTADDSAGTVDEALEELFGQVRDSPSE
jgi:hypothetical protein